MTLTDYQYRLFKGYLFYKMLCCDTMAEVMRQELMRELGKC